MERKKKKVVSDWRVGSNISQKKFFFFPRNFSVKGKG